MSAPPNILRDSSLNEEWANKYASAYVATKPSQGRIHHNSQPTTAAYPMPSKAPPNILRDSRIDDEWANRHARARVAVQAPANILRY